MYVTAPPEDGRANDAVVDTIAEWLGVKRRQVEIVSGATNRNKVVRVTNISQAQLEAGAYAELVAQLSGLPKEEVAAAFDPIARYAATGVGAPS